MRFTREHFISAPDEVFVSRLTADKPGALSFGVAMDRSERYQTIANANNELLMNGTLEDGRGGRGVSYAARLRILARGGSVRVEGNRLAVNGADKAVLLLAAATDFKGFAGRQLSDPVGTTANDLNEAAKKSFNELREAQKADHEKYFNRVKLNLPSTANSALPMVERLARFSQGAEDPALAALYFNFGRYLLISSSRPGGLPANLQGLWAEEIQTPWNGDWHLDINVQMNYWPAEVCNLSELHEPLFKLIASLVEPGRKTAKAYYNSRGWVAHVITNPWGFTRARRRRELGRHRQRFGLALPSPVGTLRLHARSPVLAMGVPHSEGVVALLPRQSRRGARSIGGSSPARRIRRRTASSCLTATSPRLPRSDD